MTRTADMTISETLAACWSEMRWEDLPADVIVAAKRFTLDTLACCVAGARTEPVEAVIRATADMGSRTDGPSSLWGRAERMGVAQAALVNGTSAHALELDDFGGCGHSGAVVIPSVIATAERMASSGRDVLMSIIAGYDSAARILEGAGGYRRHNDLGWHSCATCGSFGAAAGAARILGLDAASFADALGIAGTFTGGIWAFLADGAMTKRFHPGKAAETGTSAAFLARSGMSGPHHVLEAKWGGFFSTYAGTIASPSETLAGLGHEFRIMRSGIKPYACCRTIHAPVDSLLALMAQFGVSDDAIAEIRVHGNEQTVRQFDRRTPASLLDAQFSMQYCLALAATEDRVDLDQFQPLRTGDPTIAALMERTFMLADRELGPTEYAAVELVLADGRRGEIQVQAARGHADNPLDDDEVTRKAISLMEPMLGSAKANRVVDTVAALDTLSDIRDLTALLAVADTASPEAA